MDDWGYNLNNLSALEQIKQPLTLAVLPNLPYSRKISEDSRLLGKEIILHLPLEPYYNERIRLEKDTILASMSGEEMLKILDNDLENVHYAKGVSNHQGSKLTADEKAIKIIFKELARRGLFFIDSMTSKSVCAKAAQAQGVKFAARNVFLDNKPDEAYIEGQLRQLVKYARAKGEALGIGHDRKITLAVLLRLMPELEKKEGVKFIFASELIK